MFSTLLEAARPARQLLHNQAWEGSVLLIRPSRCSCSAATCTRSWRTVRGTAGTALPCFPSVVLGWQPLPLLQELYVLQEEEKKTVKTQLRVLEVLAVKRGRWEASQLPLQQRRAERKR